MALGGERFRTDCVPAARQDYVLNKKKMDRRSTRSRSVLEAMDLSYDRFRVDDGLSVDSCPQETRVFLSG